MSDEEEEQDLFADSEDDRRDDNPPSSPVFRARVDRNGNDNSQEQEPSEADRGDNPRDPSASDITNDVLTGPRARNDPGNHGPSNVSEDGEPRGVSRSNDEAPGNRCPGNVPGPSGVSRDHNEVARNPGPGNVPGPIGVLGSSFDALGTSSPSDAPSGSDGPGEVPREPGPSNVSADDSPGNRIEIPGNPGPSNVPLNGEPSLVLRSRSEAPRNPGPSDVQAENNPSTEEAPTGPHPIRISGVPLRDMRVPMADQRSLTFAGLLRDLAPSTSAGNGASQRGSSSPSPRAGIKRKADEKTRENEGSLLRYISLSSQKMNFAFTLEIKPTVRASSITNSGGVLFSLFHSKQVFFRDLEVKDFV